MRRPRRRRHRDREDASPAELQGEAQAHARSISRCRAMTGIVSPFIVRMRPFVMVVTVVIPCRVTARACPCRPDTGCSPIASGGSAD
jgi:hypothetical protein